MTEDEITLLSIALIACIPAALFLAARICMRASLDAILDESDLDV